MAEKQKFHIEYLLKASPEMLYQYVSTPSGLAEWFADSVQSKGNLFTFTWAGSEEKATLIARRRDSLVRFRWEADENDKYFFRDKSGTGRTDGRRIARSHRFRLSGGNFRCPPIVG